MRDARLAKGKDKYESRDSALLPPVRRSLRRSRRHHEEARKARAYRQLPAVAFPGGRRPRGALALRHAFPGNRSPRPQPWRNIGKAYSGLTDREIEEKTAFFRAHTREDFGHFRTVEPVVVLEVAFNNVMRSTRHDSGFALRFPRILRLRPDKPVEEIDTLGRVKEIYNSQPDRPTDPGTGDR